MEEKIKVSYDDIFDNVEAANTDIDIQDKDKDENFNDIIQFLSQETQLFSFFNDLYKNRGENVI